MNIIFACGSSFMLHFWSHGCRFSFAIFCSGCCISIAKSNASLTVCVPCDLSSLFYCCFVHSCASHHTSPQLFRVVFESNSSYNPPAPASAPASLVSHNISLFSTCLDVPRKSAVSSILTTRSHIAHYRQRYLDAAMCPKKELAQEEM